MSELEWKEVEPEQKVEKFGSDINVGSNDWIPCSDRLPDESLNSVIGWDACRERCVFVQYLQGQDNSLDEYAETARRSVKYV